MALSRTVPDILSDLVKEFTALFRTEIHLARAEVSEKISMVGLALALIVAGAALLMAALVLLLQAAIVGLIDQGFSAAAATLIVAGGTLVVGVLLLWYGLSRLKPRHLAPRRTVDQLQRDAAVARAQVHTGGDYPASAGFRPLSEARP
jgi:hypothetical protein